MSLYVRTSQHLLAALVFPVRRLSAAARNLEKRPLTKDDESPEGRAIKTQAWLKHVASRGIMCSDLGVGAVVEKAGMRTKRLRAGQIDDDIFVLGGACSEVFSGPRLAGVLRPSLEWQQQAMEDLTAGKGCAPLSVHTSFAVPAPLGDFLQAIGEHLPWKSVEEDWFVNTQLDGATAVMATIETLIHLRQLEFPNDPRNKVAVAERSYHGPKTTAVGEPALPRWPGAPRTEGQIAYPAPMEGEGRDQEEAMRRFEAFLAEEGKDVAVMLFEPQWGSSAAGLPWPQEVLQEAICKARDHGILVICDEIMCGLGRHGKGTLFLTRAWDLEPDAVTFGKAIACGFPFAGCVVRRGSKVLANSGEALVQTRTYAGSSTLALLTACAVLKEVPNWFDHARRMGDVIQEVLRPVSDGTFLEIGGQGLMWGGRFLDPDASQRKETMTIFRELCGVEHVWPYFVPIGGFMLSPPMDVNEDELREGLRRLLSCIKQTKEQIQGR